MSNRYCDSFYNHININSVGFIKPCCFYTKGQKPETTDENIFDWYENAYAEGKQLGEANPACTACVQMEQLGMPSRRQTNVRRGSREDNKVVFFDISFGNTCNLKCRMCESRNSTKWIADEQFLVDKYSFDLDREIYKKHEMPPERVEQIVNYMNNHEAEELILEVKGGEPFVTTAFLDFVEKLSPETKNKTKLWVITNGTGCSDFYIRQLAMFKEVVLKLSVEATGDLYNYIRGGDKHTLDDSVEWLGKCFKAIPNLKLGVSVTITMYNIFNLYELKNKIEAHLPPGTTDAQVFNNFSHKPYWLAPGILPDDTKQELISMYEQEPCFKNFIKYLKQTKHNPDMMKKFKDFTNYLDEKRSEDLLAIEPRFGKILDAI